MQQTSTDHFVLISICRPYSSPMIFFFLFCVRGRGTGKHSLSHMLCDWSIKRPPTLAQVPRFKRFLLLSSAFVISIKQQRHSILYLMKRLKYFSLALNATPCNVVNGNNSRISEKTSELATHFKCFLISGKMCFGFCFPLSLQWKLPNFKHTGCIPFLGPFIFCVQANEI